MGRARRIVVLSLGLLTVPLPFDAAHAGFFDFLFGGLQPQAPAPTQWPSYRRHSHPVYHQYKPHPRAHITVTVAHKPRSTRVSHATTDLMADETLHDGDAVMTQDGLLIFTGYASSHHTTDDFARLSEVTGLSRRQRANLTAVSSDHFDAAPRRDTKTAERTGRGGDLVTGRSATGEIITDPRGHKIRYVGP